MLSSVPIDGLGVPRLVQYIELSRELGECSRNGLLRILAHIMDRASRGKNTSSLS